MRCDTSFYCSNLFKIALTNLFDFLALTEAISVAHLWVSIPYYPGRRGLDLPRTTLRPIKMAQCASPAGMGRKERQGVYPDAGGALLLPLFCWKCVCVVWAREKEGRFKGLCLLFYKLGLYVGFLWGCALQRMTYTTAPLGKAVYGCHE